MHWIATVMQRDNLSWAFPSIGPKVMLKCKEDCVCLCVCDRVDQVFGLHRQLERDRVNFAEAKHNARRSAVLALARNAEAICAAMFFKHPGVIM